jgi:hypothetical protein
MKKVNWKVSTETKEAALLVSYEVTNGSDKTIYLLNHLLGRNSEKDLVPDHHAVLIEIHNQTVFVTKDCPPIPDRLVHVIFRTFVTLVEPGKSFRETIKIALPIQPLSPYEILDPKRLVDGEANQLVFKLAYGRENSYEKPLKTTYRDVEVIKLIGTGKDWTAPEAASEIEKFTLETPPIPILLPVKRPSP